MMPTAKNLGLLAALAVLLSSCSTSMPSQQFASRDQDAALQMIASIINTQCAARGLAAGSAEHTACFWERAAELRQQLRFVQHDELQIEQRRSAHNVAQTKFRGLDNYEIRLAQERREEQVIRNQP